MLKDKDKDEDKDEDAALEHVVLYHDMIPLLERNILPCTCSIQWWVLYYKGIIVLFFHQHVKNWTEKALNVKQSCCVELQLAVQGVLSKGLARMGVQRVCLVALFIA